MYFYSLDSCKDVLVRDTTSCRDAIETINKGGIQIALVVDKDNRLRGILTDNDLRRKALEGIDLNAPVTEIYNAHPHTLPEGASANMVQQKFEDFGISHVPAVDSAGKLVGLYYSRIRNKDIYARTPVVIMAGGEGKRLRPLTEKCPKPMLKIAGRPMLEHILMRLKDQGFRNFYVSVNYLGHVIEDYFGSGKSSGVNIKYLYEDKKLGTGGALSLLPDDIEHDVIVTNGDVITEFDFRQLLDDHYRKGNVATMGIRRMLTEIPFGVVNFDDKRFTGIMEKPTLTHYINSGIYACSPKAIAKVPHNKFYDMPTLFEELHAAHERCGVYTIEEASWFDVGNAKQLQLVNDAMEKFTEK